MSDRKWQFRNPYPKWTWAEGKWARIWLAAVALFVLVGIMSSVLKVYFVDPDVVRFRRFPDVEEMYPVALGAAQEEKPDAILAAVEALSYEIFEEETLEYEVRFYFCSPSDHTWALEVGTVRQFRLLREDAELRRVREVAQLSNIFSFLTCGYDSLEEAAYDIERVSGGMRLALSEGQRGNLEIRPRLMKLARDEQGTLLWTGVFRYSGTDYGLRVVMEAESGILRSADRIRFPEHWTTERYWRVRTIR